MIYSMLNMLNHKIGTQEYEGYVVQAYSLRLQKKPLRATKPVLQ